MAATQPYHRMDIDTELLIDLVKSRPALYDRSLKDYNIREVRTELWEEITSILFSHDWNQMTKAAKEVKAAEVLKRWNNIRTSFTRELKLMRDPSVTKHRKYIYFDKLMYLIDVTTDHVFEDGDKIIETEEKRTEERTEKKIKRKSVAKLKHKIDNVEKIDRKETRERLREDSVEYTPQRDVKRISKFDVDGDTNFALSLVPSLKLVPLDKKLDAQIDILSVLKKYSLRDSEDNMSYSMMKYERPDPLTSECDESEMLSGEDD